MSSYKVQSDTLLLEINEWMTLVRCYYRDHNDIYDDSASIFIPWRIFVYEVTHIFICPVENVSEGILIEPNPEVALRLPYDITFVVSRMDDIHLDAVYSIPVLPFFNWLTDRKHSEVLASEHLGADLVPSAAPHSNFHLIVCIVRSRIEYEDRIVFVGSPDITLPEVSVDKTWFDFTAVLLKYTKQTRNDFVQRTIGYSLKF